MGKDLEFNIHTWCICIEYDFFEPKFGQVFDIVFEESVLCVDEYIGYFRAHYNGFVIEQLVK